MTLNRTTPEETRPMINTEPTPVPGWTYEQLSELFWHHHRRTLFAIGATVVLALIGVGLLIAKSDLWILALLGEVVAGGVATWHRASARMLAKLTFPDRRVG